MPAPKPGINLLPKSEFELSYWGRILKWALTTGRYILIVVELVVIMAFLSRFKLDKDLADLGESISGKKAILDASYASELNFRQVQARIATANSILSSQTEAKHVLDVVTSYLPPDVTLVKLAIKPQGIEANGKSASQAGLGVFLARMTADKSWSSIDLSDVTAATDQGISFTLTAVKK